MWPRGLEHGVAGRPGGFLDGYPGQGNDYSEGVNTQAIPVFVGAHLGEMDSAWVYQLVGECQLIADLAFADIVIWAPTDDGSFVAVSHLRPSSAATLFYRDVAESEIRPEWVALVSKVFTTGEIVNSKLPDGCNEAPTKVRAVPIRMGSGLMGSHRMTPSSRW